MRTYLEAEYDDKQLHYLQMSPSQYYIHIAIVGEGGSKYYMQVQPAFHAKFLIGKICYVSLKEVP